jgi:hypothetical protein
MNTIQSLVRFPASCDRRIYSTDAIVPLHPYSSQQPASAGRSHTVPFGRKSRAPDRAARGSIDVINQRAR